MAKTLFWRSISFPNDQPIGFQNNIGLEVPAGTTAQRPEFPVDGTIRYNSSTNVMEYYAHDAWETLSVSSVTGEPNTGANIGEGLGLYSQKVGYELQFKSLLAGPNVILEDIGDEILISATSIGESNTASNIGGHVGLFSSKVGTVLRFRSLRSLHPAITIEQNGDVVDFNFVPSMSTAVLNATDVGSGIGLFDTKAGNVLRFKSLLSDSLITLTDSESEVTIGFANNPVFVGTGSITLPKGTTAQRPGVPTTGMIRYNTQLEEFEGYRGSDWNTLLTAADLNDYLSKAGDTMIGDLIMAGTSTISMNGGDFSMYGGSLVLASGANLDMSGGGNITMNDGATVDGRDVSADGEIVDQLSVIGENAGFLTKNSSGELVSKTITGVSGIIISGMNNDDAVEIGFGIDGLDVKETIGGVDELVILDSIDGVNKKVSVGKLVPTISFESIEELRSNNVEIKDSVIQCLSYAELGDGGSGVFYKDVNDTTSSDDGITLIVDAFGVRWKRIDQINLSLAAAGIQPDTGADLSDVLTNLVSEGKVINVPSGTYYVSSPWVVSDHNVRITGQPGATLTTDDYAVSELQINSISSLQRVDNITVESLTFKDHPPVPGGGTDNNNHPLHFAGVSNGRALFNDFVNTGLGVRFGRSGNGTVGGRGCHDGLAFANYFYNPSHMIHEFMDSDSSGNKAIAGSARNLDSSSGGHFYRFNGQGNIGALGTMFRGAEGGSGTVTAFQGGTGHLSIGNIGWYPDQGISVINTSGEPDKWCIGVHHIIKNAKDFGIYQDNCEGLHLGGIFYWDSEATDAPYLACHILGNSKYVHVVGLFDGSFANAGASHCLIEGERHQLDITLRRSVGGTNGINIQASYCQGTLNSSGASGAESSYQDIRISGTSNILCLTGERMVISGDKHLLDIVATGGNISIFASNSTIRMHGTGNLTVSGSNNIISGTVSGTVSDTGTNNNWSGFAGMSARGYTNNLTSDSAGDVTINPGLKITPRYAIATVLGPNPYFTHCTSRNATATKFRIYTIGETGLVPVTDTAGIALSWDIGL